MNSNFEKEIKSFLDKGNIITVLKPEIPYPRWTVKDKNRKRTTGVNSNEEEGESIIGTDTHWLGKLIIHSKYGFNQKS